MNKKIKPIFDWANKIGDANINNRILAKAMPALVEAKITLTDLIIHENSVLEVPQKIYDIIKNSAENLLGASFEEEK